MSGSDFSDLLLPLGERSDGRMVTPEEVERGLACDCVCPKCRAQLIARKGDVLRHHFAHASERVCGGALETALHKMAKQIIVDAGRIWVPREVVRYPDPWVTADFAIQRVVCDAHWRSGIAVAEPTIQDYRPDVVFEAEGRRTVVEVFVTHAIDEEKRAKIIFSGLDAVEIDLSRYPRHFDIKELTRFVLKDAHRSWIFHSDYRAQWDKARLSWQDEFERRKLAERRAKDFAEAARLEAAKEYRQKMAAQYASQEAPQESRHAIPVSGYLRAALMRPSEWVGHEAIPTAGAFCSKCQRVVWRQTDIGWACAHCVPFKELEACT